MSQELTREQEIELIERQAEQLQLLHKIADDYERRLKNPWGRFLLWLLRKTT